MVKKNMKEIEDASQRGREAITDLMTIEECGDFDWNKVNIGLKACAESARKQGRMELNEIYDQEICSLRLELRDMRRVVKEGKAEGRVELAKEIYDTTPSVLDTKPIDIIEFIFRLVKKDLGNEKKV